MASCISFDPIVGDNAHILILGSMPGVQSLKQQQYYAHPRNAFWPIMAELFEASIEWTYQQRCQHLIDNHIAVWDVLKACNRPGSLDQHIDSASIVANDFNTFLKQHPKIERLCFNGGKAAQLFKRHVSPVLEPAFKDRAQFSLPSTSPAHAAMTFKQKLCLWQKITVFD